MASRKLQGEIERVLKKVDEGVQIFEQIWDKVYSAATTAQKEKYEGDLKKEIKKLQRLRDQIKTWQGDSSIKDKSKLDANRKLIEEKMEKFKICEKETKTKAFSKEGLAQDRTDPRQKAKADIIDWLGDAIRKIQEQNEEMESEIEMQQTGGKRRKRNDDNPRVTELKEFMVRNERHISMLERVLRAVDNDAITPEDVNELKDSVEYYVESNQDPDFYEDDEMYDTLNLDSVPAPTPTAASRKSKDSKTNSDEQDTTAGSPTERERTSGIAVGELNSKDKKGQSPKHHSASKSKSGKASNARQNNSPARKNPQPSQSPGLNGPPAAVQSPRVRPGGPLMSSVVKSGSAAAAAKQQAQAHAHAQNQLPSPTAPTEPVARQIFKQKPATNSGPSSFGEPLKPVSVPAPQPPPTQMRWNGVVAGMAARDVAPITSSKVPPPIAAPQNQASAAALAGMNNDRVLRNAAAVAAAAGSTLTSTAEMASTKEAKRKPLTHPLSQPSNAAPNAATGTVPGHRVNGAYSARPYLPSEQELAEQNAALARAARMLPEDWFGSSSFDTSPQSTTTPTSTTSSRTPVNVPSSFPNNPASVFEKSNIFLKFDPDTLFFIFYYQQGTLQQYLAAKELKRQGWRFHKKYLTWFQRHDEPKVVNDEYETGTFIYFDYANVVFRGQGSGWCQRIKSEFVFEYRFLEDELHV